MRKRKEGRGGKKDHRDKDWLRSLLPSLVDRDFSLAHVSKGFISWRAAISRTGQRTQPEIHFSSFFVYRKGSHIIIV